MAYSSKNNVGKASILLSEDKICYRKTECFTTLLFSTNHQSNIHNMNMSFVFQQKCNDKEFKACLLFNEILSKNFQFDKTLVL